MDELWQIEMLGWLRTIHSDRVVTRFPTRQTGALLAYLAYHRHRSHPRAELIELLWPECEPRAGRLRLRVALTSLRHQLEPPGVAPGTVIVAERTSIQLNPDACITDVAQFEAALTPHPKQIQRLIEAIERYRGELLPGYYEEWILPERQRLAELFLQAVDLVVRYLEEVGDLEGAVHYARRAVSADPLREEGQHDLIRLLVAAGQPEAALRQYRELERLLQEHLGDEPAAETRALLRAIERRGTRSEPGDPEARGAGRTSGGGQAEVPDVLPSTPAPEPRLTPPSLAAAESKGYLPLQLTRFFGRETEIGRLHPMLLPQKATDDRRQTTADAPMGGSGPAVDTITCRLSSAPFPVAWSP